jgi:hypothetical protein
MWGLGKCGIPHDRVSLSGNDLPQPQRHFLLGALVRQNTEERYVFCFHLLVRNSWLVNLTDLDHPNCLKDRRMTFSPAR